MWDVFLIESRGTVFASSATTYIQHSFSAACYLSRISTSSHVTERQSSILLYPTKTNSAALMIKICALDHASKCGDFISMFARRTVPPFLVHSIS
jgi:hypothetical protein